MIVIGIDPGTIVTGYGIILIEGSRYIALDYGCIRPPAQHALAQRYLIIYEGICELLDKFKPQTLAVETQFVRENVQSAIKLGMARGIVLLAAAQRGLAISEYSPTKAKRAVVGNGRANKHQVKSMVQRLLSLREPPEPDDAADALALALCHAQGSAFAQCLMEAR